MKIRVCVIIGILGLAAYLPYAIPSQANDFGPMPKCKIVRSDPANRPTSPSLPLSEGSRLASAPIVSLQEARSYLSHLKASQSMRPGSPQEQINPAQDQKAIKWFVIPWGQEEEKLSDGLGGYGADPRRIYEYVRNNIKFEPSFGFVKGGEMTLIDGSGNAFDQTALLVDLLMMAGYQADYVYGGIHLTGEQFTNWMGIEDDPAVARDLLGNSGIPATVYESSGSIDGVDMAHMWVRLYLDGVFYALDPSFTGCSKKDGIDMAAALGYERTTFLSQATQGMTLDPNYLQNVNRANIRNSLTTYANNLRGYIETNMPGAGMEDVIGGRRIVPVVDQPLQEFLAYEIDRFEVYYGLYDGKVWSLSTMVTVSYQGWEHLFPAYDLYGERLTLTFTENGGVYTAHLWLNGYEEHYFAVEDISAPLIITIDHPYAAYDGTYLDETNGVRVKPAADHIYYILFGFGNTGRQVIEKHRKTLHQLVADGEAPTSEPVMGESLAMIGLTWMAETARASKIGDRLSGTLTLRHHSAGIVAQEDSPFMDLPISTISVIGNDPDGNFGRFFTRLSANSAFEGGTISQMTPMSGVSTIRLLDIANSQGSKIFNADSTNYETYVRPYLQNYMSEHLAGIDLQIASGDRLILPENGNLHENSFYGVGYYSLGPDGYYQSSIMGGLNGGYGTEFGTLDPIDILKKQKDHDDPLDHPQSAEPIDLFTGYYLDQKVDLSLGPDKMPFGLSFIRTYNSGACKQTGPLGLGWSHNMQVTAAVGSDGFRGMGSMSPIDAAPAIGAIYVSSDIFLPDLPVDRVMIATLIHQWFMDNLVQNVVDIHEGHNTTQFVKMADTTYRPPPGKWAQLSQEADGTFLLKTKHGKKLDFDAVGRLATWQDPNDNTVSFIYSGDTLASVSNGMGKSLHFSYDDQQRITEVADHTGRSVIYVYDLEGNLTSATDPEGNETRYVYDPPGRLTSIYHPSEPDTPFVINEYVDGGDIAKFRYDPMQVRFQTDHAGNVYSYFFATGTRTEELDPLGNSRVWEFGDQGKTVRYVNPLGHADTFAYDGIGRQVKHTMPEGNGREYVYDWRDNITEIRSFPKTGSTEAPLVASLNYEPQFNRIARVTDPLGRMTDFTYDSKGNLLQLQLPEIEGARFAYDYTINSRGLITGVDGPEGLRITNLYDPTTSEMLSSTIDPSGLNISRTVAYDQVGDVSQLADPRGNAYFIEYDANRRPIRLRAPEPFAYETQLEYDAEGNLTSILKATGDEGNPWQVSSFAYNLGGSVTSVLDPMGRETAYHYNSLQDVWRITSQTGQVDEFAYDASGRIKWRIDPLGHVSEALTYTENGKIASGVDANGNQTAFQYDDFDRLKKEIFADGTFQELTHDPAGNITHVLTRSGDTITYAYDALDRRIRKTLPGPETTTYGFDGLSRLTSVTGAEGSILLAYDNASRMSSVTYPDGKIVSYSYDASGNRVGLTYPDNYRLIYTYDNLDRMTEIREDGGDMLAQFTYDSLSRITNRLFGNGVSTGYTFLPDGSTGSTTYHFMNGTVDFNYTYNGLGLLASQEVSDEAFQYLPSSFSTTDFGSNPLNQYSSVNEQSYAYDDNGNLTSDGINTYQYSSENRLVSVTNPQHAITYSYNGLGQRVKREVDGYGTEFVHDGFHLLAEYDAAGTMTKRYIQGPGLDDLVLMQTGAGRYYYHQDRLRSVVALSDNSGNRAESFGYSPYGEPSRLSTIGNPFMYSGREYEAETGLSYFRARYYSPASGRFLSGDPLGVYGGDLNLYAYVRNNPMNFLDPLGLCGASEKKKTITMTDIIDIINTMPSTPLEMISKMDIGELPLVGIIVTPTVQARLDAAVDLLSDAHLDVLERQALKAIRTLEQYKVNAPWRSNLNAINSSNTAASSSATALESGGVVSEASSISGPMYQAESGTAFNIVAEEGTIAPAAYGTESGAIFNLEAGFLPIVLPTSAVETFRDIILYGGVPDGRM